MTMLTVMDVNIVAILIGAAVSFAFGYAYFSERFAGAAFQAINQTKPEGSMAVPMALEIAYLLLLAWLVAVFYGLQMDHNTARGIGALFGATIIVGNFSSAAWSQKPAKLAVLNSGYFVGVVIIMLLTHYIIRMM